MDRRSVHWLINGATVALLLGLALPARAADPTKDECIIANETAQSQERAGKLRTAKRQLLVCISKSCPGPVRDDCTDRLAAVEKASPTLIFAATDSSGNDVSAARVTMDGELLTERLGGTPVAVDPGEHLFRFESAGLQPIDKNLVIRETEKDRRVSITWSAPKTEAAPSAGSVANNESESPRETGPVRWPAYVAFGAGGVGLVVGTILTVIAVHAKSDADTACPNGPDKCPPGVDANGLNDRINGNTLGAEIGFGVAVVGGGVGAILLLTSSREAKGQRPTAGQVRVVPRFGVGWTGLEGSF